MARAAEGASGFYWCAGRDAEAAAGPDTLPPAKGTSPQEPSRFGPFRVLYELGRGGSGVVYAARDERDGRGAALKVTHAARSTSANAASRFLREADALARVTHPRVVRLLDRGVDALGHPWVAMAWIEGPSLAEVLAHRRVLPADEVIRMGVALADALHALHAAGIAHRDVKPSNILLNHDGDPHIADLGVARGDEDGFDLTHTGQLVGTLAYMAPEVVRGAHAGVDWNRADQWALGAVLFECLHGTRPLGTPSWPPSTPPALRDVLERMMRSAPRERYPDLAEVAHDLRRIQAGGRARHAAPVPSLLRAARAHPAAVALILLVASASGVFAQRLRDRRQVEVRAEQLWRAVHARAGVLAREDRPEEALALIEAALDDPRAADHEVSGRLWLARARLRSEGGDLDGGVSDAARALTRYPTLSADAWTVLADALWRAGELEALHRALPWLPEGAASPSWRFHAALAAGELAEAARWAPSPPESALLERWSGAVPSADTPPALSLPCGDLDGDGLVDSLDRAADGRWQVRPSSGEPWDLPATDPLLAAQGEGGWVVALAPTPRAIRLGASGPEAIVPLDGLVVRAVVGLGGDAYLAVSAPEPDVLRLTPGDPSPSPVDRVLGARGSHIAGLAAADLDGDGARELIVATGPPEGYELRVYAPGVPATLRARRRLGYVDGLAALPGPSGAERLVVNVAHQHPSPDVFGPKAPHGGPEGLYVFALEGGALVELGAALNPTSAAASGAQLTVEDLDGDALPDLRLHLVAGGRQRAGFRYALQDARGGFEPRSVGRWTPIATSPTPDRGLALHVIDDREGQRLLLGAGGTPAPAAPAPPPPDDWSGLLGWLGRADAAAQAAEIEASAPDASPGAWSRAAERWEIAGALERAARAWALAAQVGDPGAGQRAVEALVRAGDLEGAAALAAGGPRDAWLAGERAAVRYPGSDVASGLRPDPLGRPPRVAVVPGSAPSLEATFRATGPDPGVGLRLRVDQAEFSSGIRVALKGPEEDLFHALIQLRALGEGPFLDLTCFPGPAIRVSLAELPPHPTLDVRFRHEGPEVRCAVEVAGHRATHVLARGPAGETLGLRVGSLEAGQAGALFTAEVEELRAVNATLSPILAPPAHAPDPRAPARPEALLAARLAPSATARARADVDGPEAALALLLDAWALPLASTPYAPELVALLDALHATDPPPSEARDRLDLARAQVLAALDPEAALATWTRIQADPSAQPAHREQAWLDHVDFLAAGGEHARAAALARRAVEASELPETLTSRLARLPGVRAGRDTSAWAWLPAD